MLSDRNAKLENFISTQNILNSFHDSQVFVGFIDIYQISCQVYQV